MKLSKTQQEILDGLKREISEARKYESFDEYFMSWSSNDNLTDEEKIKRVNNLKEKYARDYNAYVKYYEQKKEAIILCHANTKTVEKLAALEYIEIIEPAKWKNGYETVKVLNY